MRNKSLDAPSCLLERHGDFVSSEVGKGKI